MDSSKRMHRPDLERTEPIRKAATYFRDPDSGDGAKSKRKPNGATAPANDAVEYGVRLGYTVIEEQIREGHRLAERLRQTAGKADAAEAGDLGPLIGRLMNLYKDIGALGFDAVEQLARPALRAALSRAWPGQAGTEPGPDTGKATMCDIEIDSPHRTQVTLNLPQRPGRVMPLVHALHASDPARPPLTGVCFKLEPASEIAMLHVKVPDSQPPGTYTGVIVDGTTNEPCGTLCIRLLP